MCMVEFGMFIFFFSSRRRHTRCGRDWSSDVCSSDLQALVEAFKRVRTGRANPAILDDVFVDYYGNPTPISQMANVIVEDGRCLAINPWEKNLIPADRKSVV